jgi:hypothetical protein
MRFSFLTAVDAVRAPIQGRLDDVRPAHRAQEGMGAT